MHYAWTLLDGEEKNRVHHKYLEEFVREDLQRGFEVYHSVLQLVQRTWARRITKRFDTYLGYQHYPIFPAMHLRAWVKGDDFRFKQGAEPDPVAAQDLSAILTAQGVSMHEFEKASFGRNTIPDIDTIAKRVISYALNRPFLKEREMVLPRYRAMREKPEENPPYKPPEAKPAEKPPDEPPEKKQSDTPAPAQPPEAKPPDTASQDRPPEAKPPDKPSGRPPPVM